MKTNSNLISATPFPGPVMAMTGIYVLATIFLMIVLAWGDNKRGPPVKKDRFQQEQLLRFKCVVDSGKATIHMQKTKTTGRLLYIIKRSDNGDDFKVIGAGIIPPGINVTGQDFCFSDSSYASDLKTKYNITVVSEDRSSYSSDTLSSRYTLAEDIISH